MNDQLQIFKNEQFGEVRVVLKKQAKFIFYEVRLNKMREIKFKFWDKTNKKMWYSGQEGESIGDWTFQSWFDSTSHKLRAAMVKEIDVGYNNPMVIETHLTPMQYTGLKDKNSKEIYESDVVKLNTFKGVKKGTVIFKNACFWVLVKEFNTVSNVLFPLHDNEGCTKFEVIGNICETHESLEVV